MIETTPKINLNSLKQLKNFIFIFIKTLFNIMQISHIHKNPQIFLLKIQSTKVKLFFII